MCGREKDSHLPRELILSGVFFAIPFAWKTPIHLSKPRFIVTSSKPAPTEFLF